MWLDWIWPNKKICCYLHVLKILNPDQSNWRSGVQWSFPYGECSLIKVQINFWNLLQQEIGSNRSKRFQKPPLIVHVHFRNPAASRSVLGGLDSSPNVLGLVHGLVESQIGDDNRIIKVRILAFSETVCILGNGDSRLPKDLTFLKKWANPGLFCIFSFFQTQNLQKICRLQRDLNSDLRNRRRARRPHDHNHGSSHLFLPSFQVLHYRLRQTRFLPF